MKFYPLGAKECWPIHSLKYKPLCSPIQERDRFIQKSAERDGGKEGFFRLMVFTSSQTTRIHLNICGTSDVLCTLLTFFQAFIHSFHRLLLSGVHNNSCAVRMK